jgi:hypothetical protein
VFVVHSLGGIIVKDVSFNLQLVIIMNANLLTFKPRRYADLNQFVYVPNRSFFSEHHIEGVHLQDGAKSYQTLLD